MGFLWVQRCSPTLIVNAIEGYTPFLYPILIDSQCTKLSINMTTFTDILARIREASLSERDKGTRFERLMQAYLRTTPMADGLFTTIWMWNEFPYRNQLGGQDTGIDLVGYTDNGAYWAIQCKCYAENHSIQKGDLDTFFTTSGKTFIDDNGHTQSFVHRLFISTTNSWSGNAELTLKSQQIPCIRWNLRELEEDTVDWNALYHDQEGKAARQALFTLKEHQKEAIDKALAHLQEHDRGKLIMACGTGKTFTSLRLAEQQTQGKGLVLFLIPSIALLGQTLRSWKQQAQENIYAICVCSDTQVSRQNDETGTVDLALPATTNPTMVAAQILKHAKKTNGMTVVFSTYQSIQVINEAQELLRDNDEPTLAQFDLVICDEAHRTTGVTLSGSEESNFVRIHDNDYIAAQKRIYMTATPRLFTEGAQQRARENDAVLCSMDDTSLYGEEIYRIGFGEAVKQGLLSDYKVLILAMDKSTVSPEMIRYMSEKDGSLQVDDAAKMIGVINALSKQLLGEAALITANDPQPMHRAVAFCNTIANSKGTARVFTDCKEEYMNEVAKEDKAKMVDVEAHHVDGSMSALHRDEELMWLKSAPTDGMQCRMLTNARCLSEGVDVPSLDAVVFVSPKNSQVDVVQSVGRVMRKSAGKKYGYIIIPVVVPEGMAGEKALEKNDAFKVVWTVLNALRAHDDRFNAEINKVEFSKRMPDRIIFSMFGGGSSEDKEREQNEAARQISQQLQLEFEGLKSDFYGVMVNKVGNRRYWEQWAKDIAEMANKHIERIKSLIAEGGKGRVAFEKLMNGLRRNINPSLSEQDVIEMLSQHLISQPVFDVLFSDYAFTKNNVVSQEINAMLALLNDKQESEEENKQMQRFTAYVQETVSGIDDAAGRQELIRELYDTFFKVAAPKMVEKLGIVYTPVEVVDYIIHSVARVLENEFGKTLSDDDVRILDPFTGTGTFITRLLQSGEISKEALTKKYGRDIFANEIVLMAYYIASINIESVYHAVRGERENGEPDEYKPFEGICLTDTFQLGEYDEKTDAFASEFPRNSERVIREKESPLTVIIGNPPYSVGQKSDNDNASNEFYPILDGKITNTYVKESTATSKKALHDSYIKAFRWATDRLGNKGGVIGFVTNGAWLDANGSDGMRKCFEKEFSSIYVFNLRGNQRTSGELSRKEGGKIFGSGSRTPIAITILVKKTNHIGKATIHYRDIGDYLTREDKLHIIKDMHDITSSVMEWKVLTPNEHGDWISQRNGVFRDSRLIC